VLTKGKERAQRTQDVEKDKARRGKWRRGLMFKVGKMVRAGFNRVSEE